MNAIVFIVVLLCLNLGIYIVLCMMFVLLGNGDVLKLMEKFNGCGVLVWVIFVVMVFGFLLVIV